MLRSLQQPSVVDNDEIVMLQVFGVFHFIPLPFRRRLKKVTAEFFFHPYDAHRVLLVLASRGLVWGFVFGFLLLIIFYPCWTGKNNLNEQSVYPRLRKDFCRNVECGFLELIFQSLFT